MNRFDESGQPLVHFRFPPVSQFGRIIPKDKLYQQLGANEPLKQQFVEQVKQLKWTHKLSETTVNLSKTAQLAEIEIIQVKLKAHDIDQKLLAAIDKAIPHPTLFELRRTHNGEAQLAYCAAYKVKSSDLHYVKSAWVAEEYNQQALPAALNLQSLYDALITALLPSKLGGGDATQGEATKANAAEASTNSNLAEAATAYQPAPDQDINKGRATEQLALLREIEQLEKLMAQTKSKRDKERQFNLRCQLNSAYKQLKKRHIHLLAQYQR